MTTLSIESQDPFSNPLDLVEQVIMDRDWAFDRPGDDELVAEVTSSWCNYRLWFTWQSDVQALIFSCSFETKMPKAGRSKIYPLLAVVNERLWLGHFDINSEEGVVAYRHALLMRGGNAASYEQLEDLLDVALSDCERFYPAFQSVVWGNKTPEEALELAIFDTMGEA